MKYIKELQLTNFESWHNNIIKFDKGLNIIIGNSDSGKSASFRALDAVINGKFRDSSITFGKKKSEVKIIFEDNHFASRIRGKKENIIQYDNLVFERIGKEIPNEYFEALGNTKLDLNDDKSIDLCLYSQFANHFFITSSDIEKSKIIGAACGINIIDKIVDNVNTDIRHNNTDIKYLKSFVDEQQTKINQLGIEVKSKKQKLDQLNTIINRVNLNYEKLIKIYSIYQNLTQNLIQLQNLKSKIQFLNSKLNLNLKIKSKVQNLNLLFQIINSNLQIQNLKFKIQNTNSKLNLKLQIKVKIDSLILLTQSKNLIFNIQNFKSNIQLLNSKLNLNSKLKTKIENLNLLFNKFNIIKNLLLDINNIKQQIQTKNKQLQEKINEKDNLHKTTGICPLCGSIIGDTK